MHFMVVKNSGKRSGFFYLVYLEKRNNLTSQQKISEIIAHSQVTRKAHRTKFQESVNGNLT